MAHCRQCSFTWQTGNLISVAEGASVTLSHVGTNCPKCGGNAEILDGTWAGTAEGTKLLSGPARSREIYDAFQALVREAQLGHLTSAQVQQKAAQLDEGIGKAVAILMVRYPRSFVFIIALVAMLKMLNVEFKTEVNVNFDVNQLIEQVIEYVDTTDLEAAHRNLDAAQDGQAPSNPEPTEHRTTTKQDRISHHKTPNRTRKVKNRMRRVALRKRRNDFNPRR